MCPTRCRSRGHVRPANTQLDAEFVRGFPGILRKPFEHVAAIRGVRARADFGVAAEQTERCVRHGKARTAGISELKASVLIVGAAGNSGDIDLVKVVLAGLLVKTTEF
jgi:hypothetical protein